MSMELKVLENVQKLTWNFEDVKQRLTDDIKKYADLVVSETNLPDMEKTQRQIASLRINLQKFRLKVQKDFKKPLDSFELQIKQLAELIEKTEKPIKDQIQKYEDKRRDTKRTECEKLIIDVSTELGLEAKYSQQIVVADKWLNKGTNFKEIKEDIQKNVCWLLEIQNKAIADEAARTEKISMAKMMCEFMSKDLATPLTFEDVENKIDSFNITELRTYIENQVATRKEREERAAQLALEREEQKRIAEVARQERVEQARAAIELKEAAAKLEEENNQTASQVIEPVKLYNAQFVVYGVTQEQVEGIQKYIDFIEINYKHAVKEA
ncbi:MAG: hypothetical protein K0Q87_3694 [Neobacillus sp.]|nr:hypothetical protein [Neobacillus sp.]